MTIISTLAPTLRLSTRVVHSAVATAPHWTAAEAAIPDLLPDVMYMSYLITASGITIHQYKHRDSRRYINLDDTGRAWTHGARIRPTKLAAARACLVGGFSDVEPTS